MKLFSLFLLLIFFNTWFIGAKTNQAAPALDVLKRTIGEKSAKNFVLQLKPDDSLLDHYYLKTKRNRIIIKGNSQIALCRGAYDYLKNHCNSIISWSGSKISIPRKLPRVKKKIKSPYTYRYYFNVVTHGYTTAYWGWNRWEKEFGKGLNYLADSFNEMDVPLSKDPKKALEELAAYGESVYLSIKKANPDATWVMQGWTFPFHRDENRNLFWTPQRLAALVSKIPDHKLLILDLANEYNHVFWKIDPSWKMYKGFFGKKWIYSFIPNMGGKVALNGKLDVYASIPIDALNYEHKKNLVGFGFAPEGIENDEIIYELLSDMGWREKRINLNQWIKQYCLQRYNAFPKDLKRAFELLNRSVFGTFTDHPMHRYQLRPYKKPEGVENHATVHRSIEFEAAVGAFLGASSQLKSSVLYTYDAIELTVQYLGLVVDKRLIDFLDAKEEGKQSDLMPHLKETIDILLVMDRLLASHPNHNLRKWIDYARQWGEGKTKKIIMSPMPGVC